MEKIEKGGGVTGTPKVPVAPPPPRRSIAKQRTTTSSSSRGGGGSGGSYHTNRRTSSSSSSNNNYRNQSYQRRATSTNSSTSRRTPVAPPKPTQKVIVPVAPPKPPGIATSLRSDTTYQQQMAAYAKALADYQAEQGVSRTDYNTNYQNTRRDVGLAKTDALSNLENDYAARGLLKSSLYNTDVGKLNQQYQNQYNDLDKQRVDFLAGLSQQLGSFRNEQSVQQQNAQQEALRRRAEKYNL
jgi:hypothetical protein